jgi:mono/diheme cytochrome c family protein
MKTFATLLLLFLAFTPVRAGACEILGSDGHPAPPQSDLLFVTLSAHSRCPKDVRELKSQFSMQGAQFVPAMVANRGFNNPSAGSFSFFEKVVGIAGEGEVFFGHFTARSDGEVRLDQVPARNKLMIELIAWDSKKGYYNFYELIGADSERTQWLYRGDSADILNDNRYLHLDPPTGEKKFGSTLRCSACHVSGGPIMKELAPPHNDWWTSARPLPVPGSSIEVNSWMSQLTDASTFASGVRTGILKLEASANYQKLKSSHTVQEQLRPLFCEQEINLESNLNFDGEVQIPSAFFVNPILGLVNFAMPRAQYETLLKSYRLAFPETQQADADHAWLTPVKGFSDLVAIQTLILKGLVSVEYVRAALAYDKTNPVFSKSRCALLKSLPSTIPIFEGVHQDAFAKLLAVRKAIFESEISQNPRGQILEPGFRVIFPEAR